MTGLFAGDFKAVYLALLFLVWWSYQGYFIYLYTHARKPRENSPDPNRHFFTIVVPVFNEKELIEAKVENLRRLRGGNYEVYFSDASCDETSKMINNLIDGLDNFKLIRAEYRSRSFQINQVLCRAKGDLILISDCDGLISEDALEKISAEFADQDTAVVGAYVVPRTGYVKDIRFWTVQNSMRSLESSYGHASTAVGVCYAFRKDLLSRIPDDSLAEDIYISLFANFKGRRTVYSADVIAYELRFPRNFKQFLKHKIAKAENNITEMFRFLPCVWSAGAKWLIVYLTRLSQIAILPILVYAFFYLAFFQKPTMIFFSACLLFFSGIAQLHIISKIKKEQTRLNLAQVIEIAALTNLILFIAIIKHFVLRRKVYTRI